VSGRRIYVFQPGDKVGDFEIVAKLKSGGMATLFLGRRTGAAGFAKHVAIKVVHEHLAEDETFVKMFVDEALLSARIQHPNVVHIEELRELDGRHYLVMEYIPGVSLWQLLSTLAKKKRRVNEDVAAYIAVKVADGLHSAHETRGPRGELLNVVHRDISPQNVLLSYQGNVKLIDFGVAKARGRIQEETSGGSIKGKFRYMSPEQAWGRPVDRRSDVYSLGTVLWESLTAQRRFAEREDALVIDLVRDPQPVAPSEVAEGISPELDAVVLKAQALRPEDRYATAQEFRTALLRAVPGAAILHESQLGALLRQVMADHIDKEAKKLPSSVVGFTKKHRETSDDVAEPIHTMTSQAVGIELVEEVTDTSAPDKGATGPTPVGVVNVATPSTPTGVPPAAPRKSNALIITAITAGMVAAALLGVVIVLGLHMSAEDTPATILRPTSVGASAPHAVTAEPEVPADPVPSGEMDAAVDAGGAAALDVSGEEESAEEEAHSMRGMQRPDMDDPPRMRIANMEMDGTPRMRRVLITDSF
jgi:serine/threonine protein kinase